jgi:hypothetical protein
LTSITRISALLILSLAALPFGGAEAAQFKGCNAGPTSKLTVNVKSMGAKGNGRSDDTKAIQRAIDKVAGTGGTVYLPAGIYMVRAERNRNLKLKSNMTLRMAPGATLKMFPTAATHYAVLKIANVEDINVIGGTLQGDRYKHKGRGGEWGMGVFVGNGQARRVMISNVRSRHMWGDGFYVGNGEDIAFCSVVAEKNRRQGLSIIQANRVLVTGSVFRDTRGTRPSAGIDLEPDKPHQRITNVRIERSRFINNEGGGIMIAGKKARISRVQIQHNEFDGARPLLIEYAPRVAESHICSNQYKPLQRIDMKMFEKVSRPRHTIGMQKPCNSKAQIRLW